MWRLVSIFMTAFSHMNMILEDWLVMIKFNCALTHRYKYSEVVYHQANYHYYYHHNN